MGEYADDMYRREVQSKFGFDPGSMYVTSIGRTRSITCIRRSAGPAPKPVVKRVACEVCGRRVKLVGLADHTRDLHGPDAATPQR